MICPSETFYHDTSYILKLLSKQIPGRLLVLHIVSDSQSYGQKFKIMATLPYKIGIKYNQTIMSIKEV